MAETDWQLWRSFLAVFRGGSLSGAARRLHLTQPTVGRQIAALEAELGQTLFTRSPEGLLPTAKARELAPHAEAMAAAAAAMERAASGGGEDDLRGSVRLTASEFIGGAILPPMLARFRADHPGVEIELSLNDQLEDLLRRDADLAVRNVAPTQSALVSRRIGESPVRLYAHRDYAARCGLPATASELADHALIGSDEQLRSAPPPGFPIHFAFRCDSAFGQLAALRAGFGIGYCQESFARRSPDLVPVLPEIELMRLGIWLVMHEDLRSTRRVRALFESLARALTDYVDPA